MLYILCHPFSSGESKQTDKRPSSSSLMPCFPTLFNAERIQWLHLLTWCLTPMYVSCYQTSVTTMLFWLAVLFVSRVSGTIGTPWDHVWFNSDPKLLAQHLQRRLKRTYWIVSLYIYVLLIKDACHILPVAVLISLTSRAAFGPRAMKWMMAPLCFTVSIQDFTVLSSPSVSSTISDPSSWKPAFLIAYKYNQSIITGDPRSTRLGEIKWIKWT